jgi:hypothetical protein
MIIHRTPSSLVSLSCNKWILEGGNLITQLDGDKRWNGSGGGFGNFFFASAIGWIKSMTSILSSIRPPAIYYFRCIPQCHVRMTISFIIDGKRIRVDLTHQKIINNSIRL